MGKTNREAVREIIVNYHEQAERATANKVSDYPSIVEHVNQILSLFPKVLGDEEKKKLQTSFSHREYCACKTLFSRSQYVQRFMDNLISEVSQATIRREE